MPRYRARSVRYPAFRHRNFTLIWVGLLVSNVGTWMQAVAQSWLIYKVTGNDPLYLGWLGLCFALPMVLVPPLGGVVADRADRVRLLYVTQTAALALAAILAVLTWTGAIRPWHILATTSAGALVLAFDNPTRQSLIAELVPRNALQNALSLNAATFTGAALVGPAVAGALLDVVGAGWLFAMNAASFLAVLFALTAMREVPKHEHAIPKIKDALLGGFAYAFRERWMLGILALSALAAVFVRSYQQMLPVFADDIFHVGSRGYGFLLAGGGAGALVGALGISSMRDIEAKGRVMIASGLAMCAALALFVFSSSRTTHFALAVGLVVAIGVASTLFTTMLSTMIQMRVPGPLRGRVVSLYVSTLIGLPSLGALGVAAIGKVIGVPWALMGGAAIVTFALIVASPRYFWRASER